LAQKDDRQITLDALLRAWHHKLLNNFTESKEYFNIYVESPFCYGRKCRYCCYSPNIVESPADNEQKNRYYDEILIENIREFKEILSIRPPDTVYFGGGTSSLMSLAQMDRVFTELQHSFDFRNSVKEKTFEFNPRHMTKAKLQLLMDWRFTHITVGIQTFHEGALKLNKRSSPGLDRLAAAMDLLEQYGVWYNIDLMAFVYHDDLEQDLTILKNDLEIAEEMLHPKRMTVYPNYYKLRDPRSSIPNKDHTFNKVRKMREVVLNFCKRNTYVEANRSVLETQDESLYRNYEDEHTLIRTDVRAQPNCHMYSGSGWPNTNFHQNVLALGGYGKRQPYSYMSNKLCYESRHVGDRMEYQLIYAEPELLYEMTRNSLTTTEKSATLKLGEGVLNKMLIYNIPAAALNKYQDKTVTVRSTNATALVEAFSTVPRDNLWSLQVLSMDCDADALLHLSDQVPIDLVIDNPTAEFSRLYRFAELTRKHSVRVTVQAVPGMTKAVKISQALNFSVRLEVNQPDARVVDELLALVEYYLRGSTVGSPIEPFHSLFLSFLSGRPTSLWSLQEEDPAVDRYVTHDGNVAISARLVSLGVPEDRLEQFISERIAAGKETGECAACDFFSRCQAYFKVPQSDYRCEHIRWLFALLNEAAEEMRRDEERFFQLCGTSSPGVEASLSPVPLTMDGTEKPITADRPDALEMTHSDQNLRTSFSMRRVDHRPRDFTRFSWASGDAKAVWEPRIRRVCACLRELEWRSILEGVRACGLVSVAPNELEAFGAMLALHGLDVKPLEKIAADDFYAASRRVPVGDEPFNYWCATGSASDVQLLAAAHSRHDDEAVGRLLGYPSCCRDFFNRVWVEEGFIDTTWPMAHMTSSKKDMAPNHVEISGMPRCNVLLRWLGPRMVFHLPCSFECGPTAELAGKLAEIGESAGFHLEMSWLEEMLSWPLEWSALDGLAEIKTPVGTISTATDVTGERYQVNYKGDRYATRRGWTVDFPDDWRVSLKISSAKETEVNDARSVHPTENRLVDLDWYYTDNGFRSKEDMDLSHEPIVKLASAVLTRAAGGVLDLGCGNGALVNKICSCRADLVPWGVERVAERIAHAKLLAPRFADNFVVSDIFDDCAVWSRVRNFELVILMLGRLTEVPHQWAEELLSRLKQHAKNVLVYAYDDYLRDFGSLEELARQAQIELTDTRSGGNVAMARVQ